MSIFIQDDYLAKPVRGKTLEDMLLKWAVEGKRKSRLSRHRTPHIVNDSICTASSSASNSGLSEHAASTQSEPSESDKDDQTPAASYAPHAFKAGKSKITLPALVPEEQAILLRDDKLLAAGNTDSRQTNISMPPTPSSMRMKLETPALTVQNMGLLAREFEVNPFDLLNLNAANSDGSDSDMSTNQGSTPEADAFPLVSRTELERNASSEMTIRNHRTGSYR